MSKTIKIDPDSKQKGFEKFAKMPKSRKIEPTEHFLPKPKWIRIKASTSSHKLNSVRETLRKHKLVTVCEEASCPNLNECFNHGTATFMIMGDKCTRRCAFCDVAHGRPDPLNQEEPQNIAKAICDMKLKYVVITSVDRDDLKDRGAGHFANCITEIRKVSPTTTIEILVPDFKKKEQLALDILGDALPDVFNHNLETAPRLYRHMRAGADYQGSLQLLKDFKARYKDVSTKSGLMVGLGETIEEIKQVIVDLRKHDCDMLTILNVAIAKEEQGKKLGLKMMQYLVDYAKERDAKIIYLEVNTSNTAAIALYKKLEFLEIGVRKLYYKTKTGREDALVFALSV